MIQTHYKSANVRLEVHSGAQTVQVQVKRDDGTWETLLYTGTHNFQDAVDFANAKVDSMSKK